MFISFNRSLKYLLHKQLNKKMFNLFKIRMLSIFQVIRRDLTKALRRKRSGIEIKEWSISMAMPHPIEQMTETIDFLGMGVASPARTL